MGKSKLQEKNRQVSRLKISQFRLTRHLFEILDNVRLCLKVQSLHQSFTRYRSEDIMSYFSGSCGEVTKTPTSIGKVKQCICQTLQSRQITVTMTSYVCCHYVTLTTKIINI